MRNTRKLQTGKFRVLFVYPNLMLQTTFPLAIAIFSSILKQHDCDVDIFDTTFYRTEERTSDEKRVHNLQIKKFELGPEFKNLKRPEQMYYDLAEKVRHFNPDLIAYSILEDLYPQALGLINVTKRFSIPTIAGGLFPTFAPEKVLGNDGIDIICIGEGEESLLELCNRLRSGHDYTDIPNLWVKKDGHIYKNPISMPRDLNLNPTPDFSIFDDRRFYKPMKGKVYRMGIVETSRGCPYNCSFCNSGALTERYREKLGASYFRVKDIGKIHDDLKILVEKYKVEYIHFPSEVLLAMGKDYRKEFMSMYKKFQLPFFCQNRAEVINEENVQYLVEMNCKGTNIGIEHGNEAFRYNMLNRKVSNDTYIHAMKCLAKTDIQVGVNNVIGFPEETRELVFDTVNLNRKFNPYQINAYFFTPYHGTPLWQYCIDKGYITEDSQTTYVTDDTILDLPTLSRDEIRGLVRTFTLYVRFPKERYSEIAVAERFDEEGNRMFKRLQDEYWEKYLL